MSWGKYHRGDEALVPTVDFSPLESSLYNHLQYLYKKRGGKAISAQEMVSILHHMIERDKKTDGIFAALEQRRWQINHSI